MENIIIISLIVLLSIYIFNSNNMPSMIDYIESHRICPVMRIQTKYSACVHYPPLNMGFTVSVSSKQCVSEIQQSFKDNDKKYMIIKGTDSFYLTKDGYIAQMIKLCSRSTINELIDTLGTKKTSQ